MNIQTAAAKLYDAEHTQHCILPLTKDGALTKEEAYTIQFENMKRRLEKDQENRIGMKIAYTSLRTQKQLGLDSPCFGYLTDCMLLTIGKPCPMSELIHPKIEPELAFCLGKKLQGPGCTVADVYQATAYVVPAFEICDSRYTAWQFDISDCIADNTSCARIMHGGKMTSVDNVDMLLTGMNLEKNGELIATGTTAEVLGSPVAAIAWLGNEMAKYGMYLPEGSVIMTGSVVPSVQVHDGDSFTASFSGVGSVTVRFE